MDTNSHEWKRRMAGPVEGAEIAARSGSRSGGLKTRLRLLGWSSARTDRIYRVNLSREFYFHLLERGAGSEAGKRAVLTRSPRNPLSNVLAPHLCVRAPTWPRTRRGRGSHASVLRTCPGA